MKITEIFGPSLQGEIDVGVPYTFIRVSGCNLIKEGKGCKFCDTLYAEKGKEMNFVQIIKEVEKRKCRNVIMTGGEVLYQSQSLELLNKLKKKGYAVNLETNGTIMFTSTDFYYFDKISCSPKKQCIKLDVLKALNELYESQTVRFKFVYENKNDLWWEEVIEQVGIPNEKVWIMCQGKTRKEQLRKMKEVVNYCIKKQYNFSPRLHVLIWGNKKGV
jgi:7-carboxy-7-deazaguanine synthase